MNYSKLSTYFEKLEQVSSRLTLIEILSALFKETKKEEIEKIVYLLQGRLSPFFVQVEIGMEEKTVAQSIAIAYGITREEVLKLYQKLRDMGLASYEPARNSKFEIRNSKLSVTDVVEVLNQIANT